MVFHLFSDKKMSMSQGGDLRHVSDSNHLMLSAEVGHLSANGPRDFTAYIGIDLIEDHERNLVLIGQCALNRQHNPGHFAT